MHNLPISIQTFEKIRESEMLYIDKTKFIYQLATKGKYYFLSRPRRFGKSLLLSTLESFFKGQKELFRGLYIYDKIEQWEFLPVVRIDFSATSYHFGAETLKRTLTAHLGIIASRYDLQLEGNDPSAALEELINKLATKYQSEVVVLIDEYDKALVNVLQDEDKFLTNRRLLNEFYGTLKSLDHQLRFVMLTGVSRFSKVSVFSGMNNPDDITMNDEFSEIVGFTQAEVEEHFMPYIEKLCDKFNSEKSIVLNEIRKWYNGFSFDGKARLYCPFSVIKLSIEYEFRNYWFETATPSFLIEQIKQQQYLPEDFSQTLQDDLVGNTTNLAQIPLVPLLFQTGYLTIKENVYRGFVRQYRLGFPNQEVEISFLNHLVAAFTKTNTDKVSRELRGLRDSFYEEKFDRFVQKYESYLADIPKRLHIPREAYYHSLTYMLLRMLDFKLILEKETDKGRIDGILELEDKIYVLEFKFATNKRIKNVTTLAKKAIQQIKDNGYAEPYIGGEKRILLVGIGFLNRKIALKTEEV